MTLLQHTTGTQFRSALLLLAILVAASSINAASINVPNGSFELQVAGPPFGVDTRIDSWQKAAKPAWFDETTFGITWEQLAGAFANTPAGSANHIDNMHGNQGAYMFALPEVSLFQDYNSTDWQQLPPTHAFDAMFEAGKSYHLTVGVIGGGGGMTVGSSMLLSLYYRDNQNNKITVGATPIVYTAEAFPTTTHFLDYSVDVPEVQGADAWAGQKIGIELLSTFGTGAGYWDVDNVRLLSQVPEPSAAALAGLALLGVVARRARVARSKKRCMVVNDHQAC